MWWFAAAFAAAFAVAFAADPVSTDPGAPCTFAVDGTVVDRLDCAAGGAWVVVCPIPEGPSGKIRIRATLPIDAGAPLTGEARVPLADRRALEVPISGPGGRGGGFVVGKAVGGLVSGQAIGPNQWCPVVQPGVAPGSPPRELPLDVVVTVHRQTGFAEELQAGGVTNRVPVYDAGVPYASGRAIVVQRPVGTVPVVPVEAIGPANQAVRGQVQLIGADGGWRSVGYDGRYRAVEVASGDLRVLTLDLAAPQIAAVTADDPVAWVSKDLAAWLGGDPGSLFGLVAWGRSEFHPPVAASFAPVARGGAQWSVAGTDRLEVGVTRDGDRIRVAIAWRAAPWRGSSADPVAQKAALAASVE